MSDIPDIWTDVYWPGEETLGDDPVGPTRLTMIDGVYHWYAYEWSETRVIRPATHDEVVRALLATIARLERDARKEEPFRKLGHAVAEVLPGALPKQPKEPAQ